jgi:hypothetical protein
LIRRYESGETASDLAKECDVAYQTIQSRLREAGVIIRGRGPTEKGRERISLAQRFPIDENLLRELAREGMSTREIAKMIPGNPSEECVRERMIDLGIERLAAKARPERNAFWRGGLSVDSDGYILVKFPGHPDATKGGYVRQHRLVMEEKIGRRLRRGEVVDHRNGDTSDNRPENLRLFASNTEHLAETLQGRRKLSASERQTLRRASVLRSRQRVAAILLERGNDADR